MFAVIPAASQQFLINILMEFLLVVCLFEIRFFAGSAKSAERSCIRLTQTSLLRRNEEIEQLHQRTALMS